MKANMIILDFVRKYKGKTVYFVKLSETDKYAFVMTDQYNYHSRIVKPREALERAIRNADSTGNRDILCTPGKIEA